jgi:hypothetical protein
MSSWLSFLPLTFEITNSHWDDNNAATGDHDHIMEAGERVRLEIRIESNAQAEDVYGILNSTDTDIDITDSGAPPTSILHDPENQPTN